MDIEIDQSIKIEQTNRDTAVAFSNHVSRCALIRAKDKQELQKIFRVAGKRRMFVYRVFAILVFLLIKDYLQKIDTITIDREYLGWEFQVKDYLLQEIGKVQPAFEAQRIHFAFIGKRSNAHMLAYQVTRKERKPDQVVTFAQVARSVVV